jgi:hypothetical protein
VSHTMGRVLCVQKDYHLFDSSRPFQMAPVAPPPSPAAWLMSTAHRDLCPLQKGCKSQLQRRVGPKLVHKDILPFSCEDGTPGLICPNE